MSSKPITTIDGARRRLKEIREHNLRRSREVMQLWELLQDDIDSIGHEGFVILEQVTLAALDCHRMDVTQICWERLDKKYPQSVRVRHLYGLMLEASKSYDDAEKVYKDLLDQNEGDLFSRKRRVAILKAKGDIAGAVDALVDYLHNFPADYEAWSELGTIYATNLDFPKAIQCTEELLLSQPHNYLYYQRLGELHYSAGGTDHSDSARLYFLHALRLKPDDLRSLYGLYLVLSQIYGPVGSANARRAKDGGSKDELLPDVIHSRIVKIHENARGKDSLCLNIVRDAAAILSSTTSATQNSSITPSPPPASQLTQ